MKQQYVFSLYDHNRQRKYLTKEERHRFYHAANQAVQHKRLFFLMLYYTGARISEVLSLKKEYIDIAEEVVIFQTLKRRKGIHYRSIPLPSTFIEELKVYGITIDRKLLWPFSRRTASRYVTAIMNTADIQGIQACAKGLRHSFAICAVEQNIPINLIKEWMGHSSLATTSIYLNVVGREERQFAQRMWDTTQLQA